MSLILTILALIFTSTASAQDIITPEVVVRKNIKEQLSSPAQRDSLTIVNETVIITEHGDASAIIEKGLVATPRSVNGYRIVIFMNNSQSARRDAVAVQENFTTLFPLEQSYLTYENPYFKVSVGNCSTQEEAMILLGRLRGTFPKAFIMRENIDIGEFTR